MKVIELRKKWIASIANVDEQFLRLIDTLYNRYENENETDFFNKLPDNIQDLLIESRKDIKKGLFFSHDEVIKEFKQKYNIAN